MYSVDSFPRWSFRSWASFLSVGRGAVFPPRRVAGRTDSPGRPTYSMKRCKSDELQQQQGEEDGGGLEDAVCHLPGADLRPGLAMGANSAGGPTSDAGAASAPNPGPRSKPPDLKVSEHRPSPGRASRPLSFPCPAPKCFNRVQVMGKPGKGQRGCGARTLG